MVTQQQTSQGAWMWNAAYKRLERRDATGRLTDVGLGSGSFAADIPQGVNQVRLGDDVMADGAGVANGDAGAAERLNSTILVLNGQHPEQLGQQTPLTNADVQGQVAIRSSAEQQGVDNRNLQGILSNVSTRDQLQVAENRIKQEMANLGIDPRDYFGQAGTVAGDIPIGAEPEQTNMVGGRLSPAYQEAANDQANLTTRFGLQGRQEQLQRIADAWENRKTGITRLGELQKATRGMSDLAAQEQADIDNFMRNRKPGDDVGLALSNIRAKYDRAGQQGARLYDDLVGQYWGGMQQTNLRDKQFAALTDQQQQALGPDADPVAVSYAFNEAQRQGRVRGGSNQNGWTTAPAGFAAGGQVQVSDLPRFVAGGAFDGGMGGGGGGWGSGVGGGGLGGVGIGPSRGVVQGGDFGNPLPFTGTPEGADAARAWTNQQRLTNVGLDAATNAANAQAAASQYALGTVQGRIDAIQQRTQEVAARAQQSSSIFAARQQQLQQQVEQEQMAAQQQMQQFDVEEAQLRQQIGALQMTEQFRTLSGEAMGGGRGTYAG